MNKKGVFGFNMVNWIINIVFLVVTMTTLILFIGIMSKFTVTTTPLEAQVLETRILQTLSLASNNQEASLYPYIIDYKSFTNTASTEELLMQEINYGNQLKEGTLFNNQIAALATLEVDGESHKLFFNRLHYKKTSPIFKAQQENNIDPSSTKGLQGTKRKINVVVLKDQVPIPAKIEFEIIRPARVRQYAIT